MSYTITCFRSWANEHSTWKSLAKWLQSAEGGALRVIQPNQSPYAIVRYVKGQSDFHKEHTKWCRSVVVCKETRLPVCVSPPKGQSVDEHDSLTSIVSAEEFIDGTMMNIFQDHTPTTMTATRSRVGGSATFYQSGKTFDEMLTEALDKHCIPDCQAILPTKSDKNMSAIFTSLVLQHPSNRIVRQIHTPTFTIVHQGYVHSDGSVSIEERPEHFHCTDDKKGDVIGTYSISSVRGAKTVTQWVAQQAQERGFGWQGIVLKDGIGNRWRVRSQIYETVRRIRGNESSAEERYARLRKSRTVDQYLAFYPEDREVFYELEGRLRNNTKQLAKLYGEVFRAKTIPYSELSWPYKHHVSVLHNLYKDTLRKEGKKITLEEVIQYVNGLTHDDTVNMIKKHTHKPIPSVPVSTVDSTA